MLFRSERERQSGGEMEINSVCRFAVWRKVTGGEKGTDDASD